MELEKTVERIVPKNFQTREEYLLYLRHVFAYEEALKYLENAFHVLEIGFGEGYGTHLLAQHLNSITALDVNEEAVEYANNKYGDENCSFAHYDDDTLPFSDEQFDAVISFQVVEHLENDHTFISEIHRVLKKGCSAILTTPNRETRLKPEEEPWNEFHIREYSSGQLNDLLSGYFRSVEIKGVRAKQAVETIERNRVKRKLSLYKLIPDFLKRYFTEDFMNQYDTSEYYLEKKEVVKSIDLFAIAQK